MDGIRFDGLATGLDTTALVQALLGQERRPLGLVEARHARVEARQSLFRELNTRLLALSEAARALDNQNEELTGASLEEELLDYKASSSDEAFVSASGSSTATAGSLDVRVDALAQASRRISNGFATDTELVAQAGETMSIDFGGTAPIDITIGAGGATLDQLKDQINTHAENGGMVRADVIFDGSAHRLILAGTQTGAVNEIAVTTDFTGPGGTGAFFDPALAQNASDAQIEVLGLAVTRPSNTITDVIPGVTLTLNTAHDPFDLGAKTTVDVSRDDEAIEAKVQTFVDAYNAVRDFTTAQSRFDEARGTAGLLSGDSTVRSIEWEVQITVADGYNFAGNPLSSVGQIGLVFGDDGRLELDSEALREALDEDSDAVRQLFSGDGTTDGIATRLARRLEPITRTGDGTLARFDKSFDDRISSLDRTIERMEYRLAQREEGLILQFARLESLISSLRAQGSFLQSRIGTGGN